MHSTFSERYAVTDAIRQEDYLYAVPDSSAAPTVAGTYPGLGSQDQQRKSRLASLRGYPVRHPVGQSTTTTLSPTTGTGESLRAAAVAPVPSQSDHAAVSLQSFLHRLRGYHTFQPLFTNNPAYPFLLEGSRGISDPTVALAHVDRMLDNSESHMLRHHSDDNFTRVVESVASANSLSSRGTQRRSPPGLDGAASQPPHTAASRALTVVDNAAATGAEEDELVEVAVVSEAQSALASKQRHSDGGIRTAWEPKRGSAVSVPSERTSTATKRLEEVKVWEDSELERHRVQRARYLENLHLEIEVLEKQALTAPRVTGLHSLQAQERFLASSCVVPTTAEATAAASAGTSADDGFLHDGTQMEAQRAAWLAYQSSETGVSALEQHLAAHHGVGSTRGQMSTYNGMSTSTSAQGRHDTVAVAAPPQGSEFTSAAQGSRSGVVMVPNFATGADDVHQWLYGNWSHRTHRHENAALTIQRAYRILVAKRAAYRRACARELAFQEALKAEMALRWRWVGAGRLASREDAAGSAEVSTLRATRFVADRLTARVALRRRARAQAEAEEAAVRGYAATTIQRVYRGHLARTEALCLRSPQFRQQREEARLHYHARIIQRRWRQCRPQLLQARLLLSAATIQRWYRRCVARRQLSDLRAEKRTAEEVQMQRYAVAIIERFFSRCLVEKHAFYLAHKPHVDLLQRCGRAYLARSGAVRQMRTARLSLVVALLERRRSNVLLVRSAKLDAEKRRVDRDAQHDVLRKTDAAVTIQRAWRLHVCRSRSPHADGMDEL